MPMLIASRRENGKYLQSKLTGHPDLIIQDEIGESSWFGFSIVIRPGSGLTRNVLLEKLRNIGFECRPIVAGNFAKNEVVKYFDAEVAGPLRNADYVDKNGLFVGNHHFPITEAIDRLAEL